MTETTKTSIFLALALALVGIAALSRPTIPKIKFEEKVGKPLFAKFNDPLAVKKLEIDRPDSVGDIDSFRIAEVDGVWSIPSHDNYPADAKEQMGRVSEALVGLNVLDVVVKPDDVSDAAKVHALYGVIDPTSEAASLGEGVGVKVRVAGAGDETLVDLIIGKAVDAKENSGPDASDESGKLRYVRVSNEVPVYVVEIDPERFAVNFDQWIEKNLLDISTYNIKEVFIDEYSLKTEIQLTQRGPREILSPDFRGDILFAYDSNATGPEKWKLLRWMKFRGANHDYYEQKLPEGEELNTETLDNMISAMNDLKIVDITKKPAALAMALRSGANLESIEPDSSLQKAGFYLVPIPDIKNDPKKTVKQLLSNEGNLQLRMKDGIRYTLRFGDLTGTESEITDKGPNEASNDEDDRTTKSTTMGSNRYLFITADFDESAVAKPDLKPLPEVPVASEDADAEVDAAAFEAAKVARESMEKANQREQDRFDEAVKAGRERAQKLMDRFADWYYVIPEDVYKKIRLTETNAFRPKTANKAGHGEPGHVCDDDCDQTADTSVFDHGNLSTSNEPAKSKADNLPMLPGMDGKQVIPVKTETTAPAETGDTPPAEPATAPTAVPVEDATETISEPDTMPVQLPSAQDMPAE